MFETGQREADNIDSAISDKLKKSMDSLGVAKKDELKDIQERLELLEARVLILEKIKSGEQK
jgi:polyhydroxyalkanoate synthesis regulator phasin